MATSLTLKELLKIAITHLKDFTTLSNPDFRLEQAEFDKKKDEWEIVVSFLVTNTNKKVNPLGFPTSEYQYHRIYKKLKINSQKEVLGLYIFNHKE